MRIRVYNTPRGWKADFSQTALTSSMREHFGSDQVLTSFTRHAAAAEVVETIARLNPSHLVVAHGEFYMAKESTQ